MKVIPYISIKSVLYDLSRLMPETHWNEVDFLEWATKATQKIKIPQKFEPCVHYIPLESHKATLPSNLRYLVQIAYLTEDLDSTNLESLKNIMNLASVEWSPAIEHMNNPDGLATNALSINQNRNA